MKTERLIFILLWSALAISCNNSETTENKNVKTTDTGNIQKMNSQNNADSTNKNIVSNKSNVLPANTVKLPNSTNPLLVPEQPTSMVDLYKKLDKKPQQFDINSKKDTLIVCAEGTKIRIDANSFISEKTGKEIQGKIIIFVKEYYKISDMLLANLSTTSDKNILETGGMIYISATSDNENCVLKNGKSIEIKFPGKKSDNEMQLYTGVWNKQNQINWEFTNAPSIKVVEIIEKNEAVVNYYIIEEKPEFPGGVNTIMKWINSHVRYPEIAKEKGIYGKVFVQFIINEDGKVSNVQVMRGVEPSLDKEAVRVISNMPKWKPGKMRGKPVKVSYQLPINFRLYSGGIASTDTTMNNDTLIYDIDSNTTDENIKKVDLYNISDYLFSSTKLGWINCDRLYNNKKRKINYLVQLNGNLIFTDVKIIFHNIKSILPYISFEGNTFHFRNVPIDEKITIVALKIEKGIPYIAIKNTKTSAQIEKDLVFEPVTMEKLKAEIKALDNL